MKIAILSVGDELLQGNVVNTNATFFSKELHTLGYHTDLHLAVNDEKTAIEECIKKLHNKYDLIIASGGLGPTSDDITKESIAAALDIELEINAHELQVLKDWFAKYHTAYQETNTKQALFSTLDTIVVNHNGTANGYYFTKDKTTYWVLPGPPRENRVMFKEYLATLTKQTLYEKNIYLANIGESTAETMMHEVYAKYPTVRIGTYVQDYGIIYRLIATDEKMNERCYHELKNIFKDFYIAATSDPIKALVNYLIEHQLTIATAESISAGMCAALLADIPGSSAVLKESFITYSNEAKMKYLKVKEETLLKHTAISKECAQEMVAGLYEQTKCDICLSLTGLAGPGGATATEPVGSVYFGLKIKEHYYTYHLIFKGERNDIRLRASKFILLELYKQLQTLAKH